MAGTVLAEHLPESPSLSDVLEYVVDWASACPKDLRLSELQVVLAGYLRKPTDGLQTNRTVKLLIKIGQIIAPIAPRKAEDDEEEASEAVYGGATEDDPYQDLGEEAFGEVAHPGLVAMGLLQEQLASSQPELAFHSDSLVTVIAHADESEPWVSERSAPNADDLLRQEFSRRDKNKFIEVDILKEYLRPLFSKSRPPGVTPSGRKAEYRDDELERRQGMADDSRRTKPWKFEDLRSIPAFAWAVENADEAFLTRNWQLFTPVLLTLMDDNATRVRSRGLQIARDFISNFPRRILLASGMDSVLEEAMMPTLNYLPTLTPEKESLALLEPAYEALIELSCKLDQARDGRDSAGKANKLRDRILRRGVFPGYWYARDNPKITILLMDEARTVVEKMGIHAVKHLKDIILMLKDVFHDPFVSAHIPRLQAAIYLLHETLLTCWAIVAQGNWQFEILIMMTICWTYLGNDIDRTSGNVDPGRRALLEWVQEDMRQLFQQFLMVARNNGKDLTKDYRQLLVTAQPELAAVFARSNPGWSRLSQQRSDRRG